MAIYHYRGQVISRSKGRSSVAAAAYRSGTRLVDRRTGLVHDYTRRRRTEIVPFIEAPEGAPAWARDREELWNRVEEKERRKDSQLAREFDLALPVELSRERQTELVRGYVREQFVGRGMVADVAMHWDKEDNPHAHVMLTMREVLEEGFGAKVREWNERGLVREWRQRWAEHTNERLREAGCRERVDHRSFKDRGIEREPTRHEGPHVREMERRGIRTSRGDLNRAARQRNEERERQYRREERDRVRDDRNREIDRDFF